MLVFLSRSLLFVINYALPQWGVNALFLAAQRGSLDMVRLLVVVGKADVCAQNWVSHSLKNNTIKKFGLLIKQFGLLHSLTHSLTHSLHTHSMRVPPRYTQQLAMDT